MTFGAHKLVHSEPFLTPDATFDKPALYSDMRKNIYRCASTILPLKDALDQSEPSKND